MRRSIAILFAFTLGWAVLAGASTASADTIVSLTFDDGNADQMPAVQMLDDHDMAGTFYIIPNRVGRPDGYMTWSQVQTIFDHGNEIGGHTLDHKHLPDLSEDEQRDQICDGRQALLDRGYPQLDFAYPFGEHDSTSEDLVQECGYLSGRTVSGLQGDDDGGRDANAIPPANPYVVYTRGSVDVGDTLAKVKDWIMTAEESDADNGPTDAWIPLVWHHLCDPDDPNGPDCSDSDGVDDQYMTPADFDSLLDWLQARDLIGTHVETMEQVMTGQAPDDTTPPTSSIQCNGAACSGFYNPSVSVKLFGTDSGGSGLKSIHYTTDGSTPDASDPSVTSGGSVPISSTTTIKFRAEDNAGNLETATNSKTIQIDSAKPASSIQCNGSACQSTFYNGAVTATLSGSDSGGSGLKSIHYTTDNSTPDASDPSVANGGSVSIGSTTTLKFRAEDNAGNLESTTHTQAISIDTTAPTGGAIKCNGSSCQSTFYNAAVQATFSANDSGGSGLNGIRYTTDNSTPNGSSPLYVPGTSGPVNVGSTTTIKFRGQDKAGNLESTTHTQTISIDTVTPTNSAIQCNGSACQSSFYNAAVQATFSANDSGGSGLNGIRYTTDNSTPNGSSPLYVPGTSGPVNVGSTTTIKFRAQDNAGNLETATNSKTIQIDTAKPTSSILCDGAACSPSYDHAVQATFTGSDSGGSGLNGIRYTTNGSTPNGSSQLYVPGTSPAINVGSTTTIKFIAQDKAGNLESPVHTQAIAISIDAASPTSSILCDGAPCLASYDHPVAVTLSATDTGGSGLKAIRYTTDGTDPTGSSPIYTDPITVDETTTIKFRAEDNAGNVETAHSQTIEITSEPPTQPQEPGGGTVGSAGGTLGAFSAFKSLPNGSVKLTLQVTGAGEIVAVDAAVTKASAAGGKQRKHRIKRSSKSVAQAGLVTLVIKPSKAGKRALRRKGKLTVPVRIIFTPATGSPVTETVKVKLRLR